MNLEMFDVRHLVVVVTLCFVDDVCPKLTTTPQNAIVVAGQLARFNCTTNSGVLHNPITWADGRYVTRVTTDCTVTNAPKFASDTSRGNGSCDLDIVYTNISSLAGPYTCTDSAASESATAILIVLESEPVCVPDRDPLVQGQPFNITCNGNFTFGTAPVQNPPINVSLSCGSGPGTSASQSYSTPATFTQPLKLPSLTFTEVVTGTTVPPFRCSINTYFSKVSNQDPTVNAAFATNSASFAFSIKSNSTFECIVSGGEVTNRQLCYN